MLCTRVVNSTRCLSPLPFSSLYISFLHLFPLFSRFLSLAFFHLPICLSAAFFPSICFLLLDFRNYDAEFVRPLVTPLYRPLSLCCISRVSVLLVFLRTPFNHLLSLFLCCISLLSPLLPLSSSHSLHLSVLLYTHCKDLGNEVNPPPLALPSAILRPLSSPSFPAAAKSLAGLLRRQKFNIAVTLRWLYVLTVSLLYTRITYYYRRATARSDD